MYFSYHCVFSVYCVVPFTFVFIVVYFSVMANKRLVIDGRERFIFFIKTHF